MKLSNALRSECIAIDVEISSKDESLRKIARVAKKSDVLAEITEEQIYNALLEREELGTTGFGGGIAIPHCRIDGISEFVIGIITIPKGVDFNSLDGEKVKIMVFIIAPAGKSNEHIRFLSKISHILSLPNAAEEIINSRSPEIAKENFLRHIVEEEEPTGRTERKLFHIFIQDDNIFRELLQVFSAFSSSSIFVIEAKNTREYLAKSHLFSAFWKDEKLYSSKIIIATVDKHLVNETIRQIERIVGVLEKCKNVLVIVQDTFFVAGDIVT